MNKKSILIVEDDKVMSRMLVKLFSADDYKICAVYTVEDALHHITANEFDLAILDLNLPDGSGYDICQEMIKNKISTGVIFLTANDLEQNMLRGYELGAVDYITKPFNGSVLRYKVNAIFTMLEGGTNTNAHQIYDDGLLYIDFSAMQAKILGEIITFAPLEYRVLEVFIENHGILLTRQKLFEKLWDSENNFVEEHTLTAAISRIRKKLDGTGRTYIQTVYGMGYMFLKQEVKGKNEE